MRAKIKIWIEDSNHNLIFGSGKTQMLEYIETEGSILAASKKVGMNYKKAWSHIKILENNIQDTLVISQKGRSNGGTKITNKAKEIMNKYKIFEDDVKKYTQTKFEEIFKDNDLDLIMEKRSKNDI